MGSEFLVRLLLVFRHGDLVMEVFGSAGGSAWWQRESRSLLKQWNGLVVVVCWRFGSTLALPASQDLDGAAEVGWLSFNGVTLVWIDVGKGLWVDWMVWGMVIGRIFVMFLVLGSGGLLEVPSPALSVSAVLLRLGRCVVGFWCGLVASSRLLPYWLVLNPCWVVLYFSACALLWCVLIYSWVLFSFIGVDVGQSLCDCLCMHSWCDMPALGWRRVIVNWTLPPSGWRRYGVTGVTPGRPHTGNVVGLPVLMRLTDVVFPVGHRVFLAIDMAFGACLATWCLFEYIDVVETPDIISGSPHAYCLMGFRSYVPPLYSFIGS